MSRNRVLVVDDEKNQREIYTLILGDEGYSVTAAQSAEQALRLTRDNHFDLVLTDYKMTGMDGLTLLGELLRLDPSLIVVMMTAHGSVESVKEALRGGAFDYLSKPIDREELLKTVQSALGRLNSIDDEIIGGSDGMERVKKMILKVAGSSSTVLIRGESGVGKEMVARAIHKASPRAGEIFQAVNCAAINENLLESELFGHERGSFTGAHAQKKGQFEIADRGTLFLDEIGDLNINMQAKVLRALQEKEVMRVGGTRPIKVDVRVIAATNRELETMVKENRFREDLYYRLNIIPIVIPPLRNRREDIADLIDFFVTKHSASAHRQIKGLTAAARKLLTNYSWPGNVRQLESAMERAILLCEGNELDVEDLPVEIRQEGSPSSALFKLPPEGISFEEVERSLITQAMEQTGWNITRAAKLLGLSFRTLQYRLEKFNLKKSGRNGEGTEETE
jgi:DNA-binding NtrC family response regulator